jgi:hypothetical protein
MKCLLFFLPAAQKISARLRLTFILLFISVIFHSILLEFLPKQPQVSKDTASLARQLFLSRGVSPNIMTRFLHSKARTPAYTGSSIQRFVVPDDKVPWSVPFPEYTPIDYTAPVVLSKPVWADVDITTDNIPFNEVDGKVDRRSFEGKYDIVDGKPLNPFGRTGLKGRGLLGRWGPNHAADPVVSRYLSSSFHFMFFLLI